MEMDKIHQAYSAEVIARKEAERKIEKLQFKLEAAQIYRHELHKRLAPRVDMYMRGYYRAKVEDGVLLSDVDLYSLDPLYLDSLRRKAEVDMER